jgi:hypothetical protein
MRRANKPPVFSGVAIPGVQEFRNSELGWKGEDGVE